MSPWRKEDLLMHVSVSGILFLEYGNAKPKTTCYAGRDKLLFKNHFSDTIELFRYYYTVPGNLNAFGIFPACKDRRFLRVYIFQFIWENHLFAAKQDSMKESANCTLLFQ